MTLIYRPKEEHHCKPLMETIEARVPGREDLFSYERMPPIGTIWRCECGRLWKVVRGYANVMPARRWIKAGIITRLRVHFKIN